MAETKAPHVDMDRIAAEVRAKMRPRIGGGFISTRPREPLPDLSQRGELHRLLDVAMDFQDRKYGPFASDVIAVRAAIGFLQDEAEEARQAWHEDSRPGSEPWARTAEEVMQVAGVAMRLMLALGVGTRSGGKEHG